MFILSQFNKRLIEIHTVFESNETTSKIVKRTYKAKAANSSCAAAKSKRLNGKSNVVNIVDSVDDKRCQFTYSCVVKSNC
jgi:hypothetical protein